MGPRWAEWGRVGPVRVEWGWGGVGHALGFKGGLGLSGAGEGLGMHWDSRKLL